MISFDNHTQHANLGASKKLYIPRKCCSMLAGFLQSPDIRFSECFEALTGEHKANFFQQQRKHCIPFARACMRFAVSQLQKQPKNFLF